MITKELIERINELARKQKTCALNAEEKAEQQLLRRTYIDCVKDRVKEALGCVKFAEDENDDQCDCGCGGQHKH